MSEWLIHQSANTGGTYCDANSDKFALCLVAAAVGVVSILYELLRKVKGTGNVNVCISHYTMLIFV